MPGPQPWWAIGLSSLNSLASERVSQRKQTAEPPSASHTIRYTRSFFYIHLVIIQRFSCNHVSSRACLGKTIGLKPQECYNVFGWLDTANIIIAYYGLDPIENGSEQGQFA